MAWLGSGLSSTGEDIRVSPLFSTAVATAFRLRFDTQFPSRHRLIIGVSRDVLLSEIMRATVYYPSAQPLVLVPSLPSHWLGDFAFYFRLLPWGDSLPPLLIAWDYWVP